MQMMIFQGSLFSWFKGEFVQIFQRLAIIGWKKTKCLHKMQCNPLVLPCGQRCRGHFHVEDPLPRKREKPGGALEDITHLKIYTYRTYYMVLQSPKCILTWLGAWFQWFHNSHADLISLQSIILPLGSFPRGCLFQSLGTQMQSKVSKEST